MQVTVKAKINVSKVHEKLLKLTQCEYVRIVNHLSEAMIQSGSYLKLTSKDIQAELPSTLRCQAALDAKSVYKKYRKTMIQSILKKPMCVWNNQNWTLTDGILRFPVLIEGKSQRISVPVLMSDYQLEKLTGKLGTLRITEKSGKWMAQIAVEVPEIQSPGAAVMGVDLGLKCPAVAVTDTGKTRFFGNGRQNKVIKRKFRSIRRKLGKLKKLPAIKKLDDKEQRWMKEQDHKISRQIVNLAIHEGVGIIRLEQLSGIRQTARTSRKNAKNLHTWSFYRLAHYIGYKAAMAGITVEYVDPKYTSQTCPACGERNKSKDRNYRCSCGYHTHRDRLGAINIMVAPVSCGNSTAA